MPPLLIRDGRQPTRGEPLQRYRRDHPPNACPQHDCCRVDNGRVEVCADGRAGFIQQRRRHEHRAVPNALLSLSLHICGPRALRPTPRRACVRAVCSRLLYPRTSRLPPPVPLAGPFSATAQCSVDSRTASMQDSEHAGMHTRDTAHSMQEMCHVGLGSMPCCCRWKYP